MAPATAAFLQSTNSLGLSWQIVPSFQNIWKLIAQNLVAVIRRCHCSKGKYWWLCLKDIGKGEASASLCQQEFTWLGEATGSTDAVQGRFTTQEQSQSAAIFRFLLHSDLSGWWRLQPTCESHSGGVCVCSLHLLLFLSFLVVIACLLCPDRTLWRLFPTSH